MFIIIQYRINDSNYANSDIVEIMGITGKPIIFGSEHSAEQHARECCRLNYKIVEL